MIIVTLHALSIAWALYKLRMNAKLRPPESFLPDSHLGTYNLGITQPVMVLICRPHEG